MALQLPGIGYLRGYDTSRDILGEFARGHAFTRGLRDEEEAKNALEKYVDSLFGGSQAPPPSLDTTVRSSHDAAVEATDPMLEAYFRSTRRSESGGNDAADNPNSSALGRYQFLDSTWKGLMEAHPELGLTADGRTDPAQQERAIRAFTMDNARSLRAANQPINPGTLYAAHFLGAGGASNVLGQADDTPLMAVVGPEVIQANPFLQDMTVGQFREWAANKGGNGSGGYAAPQVAQAGGEVPQDVLASLVRNPLTRELGVSLLQARTATGKPIEVNGRLVNPATGEVIADFSDPKAPTVVTRYNPETGMEEKFQWNAEIGDWEPFGGQKAATNGLTVTTNADGTTTVTQGGPAKLTEAQGKDLGYYTRGNEANTQLTAEVEKSLTDLGGKMSDLVPLGLGNYLKTPEYRQAKVAADNFLAAILRKDTGAAVTPVEFELYGGMFLPIPGDDTGTIEAKRRMRTVALLAIKSGLGTAEAVATANEAILGTPPPAEVLEQMGGEPGEAATSGGDYPEGTVIANDAGDQLVMRNGEWVPL